MKRFCATVALVLYLVAPGRGEYRSQDAPPMGAQPGRCRLKCFTVTLVLGSSEAGPSDNLAPDATKALLDLKEFLPYKKYRLLDVVQVVGLDGPHVTLRGLNGQEHEFFMRGTATAERQIRVEMLRLWDGVSSTPGRGKSATHRLLIDTSFGIDPGETVVVGTSRLESGSEGLILIVTAFNGAKSE